MNLELSRHCHVCFVKPYRLLDYSSIIQCTNCGLTCHRSCYLPQLKGDKLKCDACLFSGKKIEICFICGNQGLLKKVDDQFAHPVCLLFSSMAIVVKYSSLTFSLIKQTKHSKNQMKKKCSICNKTGEVQKCFANCSNSVHMYCAWKSYQNQHGWNHNPIVQNFQYSVYFEKKSKSYLQPVGQVLKSLLSPFSEKSNKKSRQFELACPDHNDTIFQCCTDERYFNQIQIDYIQCDQCFKWYHKQCLGEKSLIQQKSTFICPYCYNFWKLLKQHIGKQFYLEKFPRLNICEMIYIQFLFEKRMYKLSKSQTKFMFSLPIEPSLLFIESLVKINIEKRLKVEHFMTLNKLKLSQRVGRKTFKDKFKKNIEPLLILITERKSLFQLRKEKQNSTLIQLQKNISQQEMEKLKQWISLLNDFQNRNPLFTEVVWQLVRSLERWLKTLLKEEEVKSFESSSNFSMADSYTIKTQNLKMNEVKVKQYSSGQDSQFQTYSRSQPPNQSQSKSLINKKPKINRNKNKTQSEQLSQTSFIFDPSLQKKILSAVKRIKNNIYDQNTNQQKLTQKVLKEHSDKVFFLQLIFNQKFTLKSILNFLFLQATFKSLFALIQLYKNSQNNPNPQNHLSQTKTSISTIINISNSYNTKQQTKITFIKRYCQKIIEIYESANILVRKKFKQKIQFLIKSLNDFVDVLKLPKNNTPKKLSFNQAFQKFFQNPRANGLCSSLKAQIKTSFDQNQLKFFRLQMQKTKIYLQMKKVQFSRLSSNVIAQEYENYCKSSSQQIQSSQKQKESKNSSLRQGILETQKKALENWIKIFSLLFNLANDFLEAENKAKEVKENEPVLSSKASFIDEEPIQVIEKFLDQKLDKDGSELKRIMFKSMVIFFSKLKQSQINYRVFHPKLTEVVQKMGKICIQLSFFNVPLWSEQQESFSAVKSLYKSRRNAYLNVSSKWNTECFEKIWKIFESDELYSEFYEENRNLLLRDPEYSEMVCHVKIPQMIKFYQEVQILCRIKQLKRLKIWISYYLHTLTLIGSDKLVEPEFFTLKIKHKYQPKRKIFFNQLAIIISDLHKIKFPQSYFTQKIIEIFKKAQSVEKSIENFLEKQGTFIQQSYQLKDQFVTSKDIQNDCLSEELCDEKQQGKMSSKQFRELVEFLSKNEVLDIFTFEIQREMLMTQHAEFRKKVKKAEQIMITKNETISIKDLSQLYFQILSYPFSYVNLKIFLTFISKRVQRHLKLNSKNVLNQQKQKQVLSQFQKSYQQILAQLDSKSKIMSQRLTKEQLLKKLQIISEQQGYKLVQKSPSIQKLIQSLNQKISAFDSIKYLLSKYTKKIPLNKTLQHQQIQQLGVHLSSYKAQNICEFQLQILSNNTELYRFAFSAIPKNKQQISMALQQLRTLKKPFKNKEFMRRLRDLEEKLDEY